MIAAFARMMVDESGAALAEYGIIAASVAAPFVIVALAIDATASNTLGATTAGMQTIGVNPP